MNQPNPILHHSADVWFDDGNIVLVAEQTAFKVYHGLLQMQSPFFRDLLTLPQPGGIGSSEKYEGCPLVPIPDESAKDVTLFLKALFDPQFYTNVRAIKDYSVFASVMRLGDKYQVEFLVRRSLPVFTAIYPATLQKWDGRHTRRQFSPLFSLYGRALPFVTIDLAHRTGMEVLLPAAYLECCAYPDKEIVGGVLTPGGSAVRLSVEDQAVILEGRARLVRAARMQFSFLYDQPLPYVPAGRRQALHDWVEARWVGAWLDPFTLGFPWKEYRELRGRSGILKEKKTFDERRLATWKALPATFGLAPWDKIKRIEMQ